MKRSTRAAVSEAKAFTLIELLVVVAIIAIVAMIALPNFLEAQTRAKVSREKTDMRTVSLALECYAADNNHYPVGRNSNGWNTNPYPDEVRGLVELSTPVAYLTSVDCPDPIIPNGDSAYPNYRSYFFFNYEYGWASHLSVYPTIEQVWGTMLRGYMLKSWGPDRVNAGLEWHPISIHYANGQGPEWGPSAAMLYDPTNGTVSYGDMGRFGGSVRGPVG